MSEPLRLMIRTPGGAVFDGAVGGLRVPTETGQVGLRPRGEPMVLVVEAGLIVIHATSGEESFAGTVGGLLTADGSRCELFTPQAVVGTEDGVVDALEQQGRTPDAELAARRRLGELEERIVRELGRPAAPRRRGTGG